MPTLYLLAYYIYMYIIRIYIYISQISGSRKPHVGAAAASPALEAVGGPGRAALAAPRLSLRAVASGVCFAVFVVVINHFCQFHRFVTDNHFP